MEWAWKVVGRCGRLGDFGRTREGAFLEMGTVLIASPSSGFALNLSCASLSGAPQDSTRERAGSGVTLGRGN